MEVQVLARDNHQKILSITLTFLDKDQGLGVARMLEAIARNQWWSTNDTRRLSQATK